MNNIAPSIDGQNKTNLSLVIHGCAVSITSTPDGTHDPLVTVKEILLTAYRTKQPKGLKDRGFFDVGVQK